MLDLYLPDIQVNGAGFSADSGLAVYADVAKAHQQPKFTHPTPHESCALVEPLLNVCQPGGSSLSRSQVDLSRHLQTALALRGA